MSMDSDGQRVHHHRPGGPADLMSNLTVLGPDGRSFLVTEIPAAATVADVAAAVLAEHYPDQGDFADELVIDRVTGTDQNTRLDPQETLHEAGIRDGDRIRIGAAMRAAGGGVLFVASLAGFLGGFLGAFAKDMGTAAGKASAEALRGAARRLRDHLRESSGGAQLIMVDGQQDGRLLVIENLASLSGQALEQLVSMELPAGPVRLTWDSANGRWRSSPSRRPGRLIWDRTNRRWQSSPPPRPEQAAGHSGQDR